MHKSELSGAVAEGSLLLLSVCNKARWGLTLANSPLGIHLSSNYLLLEPLQGCFHHPGQTPLHPRVPHWGNEQELIFIFKKQFITGPLKC